MNESVVNVISHRAKIPTDGIVVDTTSKSPDFKGLSPFFLGPIDLYGNHTANVFENAWQYCKVYACHADADNNPTAAYYQWAADGWAKNAAVRYPMGRGARPLYSLWDGQKLGYIDARKQIYCQLYEQYVCQTDAWERLYELHHRCVETGQKLYLRDYDGYVCRKHGQTDYATVINNPDKKMGHAFVLAMMLEGVRLRW